jgi:anti-anti-sigma regulatory factor
MDIKEDKYLVGAYEDKRFVKFVGNSTMKNSKTLDDYFDNVFAGEPVDLIMDFEECNYMDSTILGLIAKTAISMKKLWNKKIFAIKIPNMIQMSLKSTGVYKLLEVVSVEDEATVEMEELEKKDFQDKRKKAQHILEVHKTLMDLSDENKEVFKNVVELLEKELGE